MDLVVSVQEMSSIAQEIENLRERMAQLLRRQQRSEIRSSNLATIAPTEASGSNRSELPAYSEVWRG